MSLKRIVILFSGEGGNLENLIKKLHNKELKVVAAITNNPDAKGIQKAKVLGIDTIVIDHRKFDTREKFDEKLVESIQKLDVDLAVLAGFMRILTPVFTNQIKAVNIHPSLLPMFKGANALKRSFQSDMKVAGVTVHEVVTEVDAGEIIAQYCFEKSNMDLSTFEENIRKCEYDIFPKAVLKALR